MKNKILIALLALVAAGSCSFGLAACDSAEKEESASGELEYTLSGDQSYYICTGLGTVTAAEITIAAEYNGLPVKEIGESAFFTYLYGYDNNLTKITIPDSVTTIDAYAFSHCHHLTEIAIPDGVTSIEKHAFYYCNSLTKITLPDGVTSIGAQAFEGCESLTDVTLPDGVTSIGEMAFYGCGSLTEITLPDSVTSIGSDAFTDCTGLTAVYYTGSAEEWNNIVIGSSSELVLGHESVDLNALVRYYSETQPTGEGNYWHYDENGGIVVW